MIKKSTFALIVILLLVPATANASYRFGAGGYIGGLISGGAEFKFYLPVSDNTDFFIAPHCVAVLTSYSFWHSLGVRGAFMFNQNFWASPLVGISAGMTGEDGSSEVIGARLFAGLSFAPLMMRNRDIERADLLRIDLEMGLAVKNMWRQDVNFWFPNLGGGISFNW
ncbi:hypothetical protein JXM67_13815 [candidate division WOR-3 bacterium]|nr:hypothetical protein [candidate division WOR-3 bacterium]